MDTWVIIHSTFAFFALMMAIISFWLKKSPWLWGAFLVIACLMAYFAKVVAPIAILPIGALFVIHGFLRGEVQGMARLVLVLLAVGISIGLWVHLFPGFRSLPLSDSIQIGKNAVPFKLSLQFDKPFVGFFVLAWSLPLLQTLSSFKQLLKAALPFSIVGMAILATLSIYSGMIAWDPKFPSLFWLFAPINLILVTIPEEAFMRGFVQNECVRFLGGRGVVAQTFGVLITALFFAALHYAWAPSVPFLGLVFVAGIIYGAIYQLTNAIEASILCHFLFNIAHFLLFSYPALKL